jgi:hypothetical protein
MRLSKARVTKYRSVRDSGWFEIEAAKTIFVGPNEAGKSAMMQALQQINRPEGVRNFDALRDYPRSEYNDITTGKVKPGDVTVVEAHFALDDDDKAIIPQGFADATYVRGRRLDNSAWHTLIGGPAMSTYSSVKKDLAKLVVHVEGRMPALADGQAERVMPGAELATITGGWNDATVLEGAHGTNLDAWLQKVYAFVDEDNREEEDRHARLVVAAQLDGNRVATLKALDP